MTRWFGNIGSGAFATLGCLFTTCVALPASALEKGSGDEAEAGLGNHQRNIRLELGGRFQWVKSAGFDPFSKNDVLPQLSLGASLGFWSRDRLSLAANLGFDYGEKSADARSDTASLAVQRYSVAPELRYHLLRTLALTAKVGPTLTRESAQIAGGLETDLSKVGWQWGVDATAGVAVELWGYRSGASRKPRLWVLGEGGYGYSAPLALRLAPVESGGAPARLTPLDLGELALSGPLFRVAAGLSFW